MNDCPPDKIRNPVSGRCVSRTGKIGMKILGEEPQKSEETRQQAPKVISTLSLDTDGDNYISIKEYLSEYESKLNEEKTKGRYRGYAASDLQAEFFLRLISDQKNAVSKIACIPLTYSCVYYTTKGIVIIESKDKFGCTLSNLKDSSIRARVTSSDLFRGTIFSVNPGNLDPDADKNLFIKSGHELITYIPSNFPDSIKKCEDDNKEIVLVNLNLRKYRSEKKDDDKHFNHANILIINTVNKTIERFEPHGSLDDFATFDYEYVDREMKDKLKLVLPNYKYLTTYESCPYFGPQIKADTGNGMCFTWATMYGLLRVLNPKMSRKDIVNKMTSGSRKELLNRLLRFHKYIVETLQKSSKSLI